MLEICCSLVIYSNISPGFILILNDIQEKQLKTFFLKGRDAYDDVIIFEVCEFMKNTKI